MGGHSSGLFCSNYINYFLLTWLPFYLVRERGYSMSGMARVGGAMLLTAAISAVICGKLSDRWVLAGATNTKVRKGFMVVGTFRRARFSWPPWLRRASSQLHCSWWQARALVWPLRIFGPSRKFSPGHTLRDAGRVRRIAWEISPERGPRHYRCSRGSHGTLLLAVRNYWHGGMVGSGRVGVRIGAD